MSRSFIHAAWLSCALAATAWTGLSSASASVCATVKMELSQELSLEREAFDAHMRINNAAESLVLTNVQVLVSFKDAAGHAVVASSDPNATNALFFIRVDSLTGIDNVAGTGTVGPNTTADIHWRIIPAPGAGGQAPQGVLYYVGASLTYKIGSTDYSTEVTPDAIYVRPMPVLALDYFLPGQVYGDDAFTPETEPPVPFTMGLRIRNVGYGSARNLKLNSGQPEVVANENGLLVGYTLRSCEINGVDQPVSLLAGFGTLRAAGASSARWTMTCSLSGTFTNFTAEISHSDELGGQLTSLIPSENIKTHLLIHDVRVDLPGRDSIRDFLAGEDRVYESDGTDSAVANVSSGSVWTADNGDYILSLLSPQVGFIFVSLPDPVGANMAINHVARSDGKALGSANAWISKQRKPNPADGWNWYVNLFDANPSNCTYRFAFASTGSQNLTPVISPIDPVTVYAGENLGLTVNAGDDSGVPALTAGWLPIGARFLDRGDGIGFLSWTPSIRQAGSYWVRFQANDGALTSSLSVALTVLAAPSGPWPGWWERRMVLAGNGALTNDFAAANQGSAKHLAAMAWAELNTLPGGPGFSLAFSNAQNYAAVSQGQLKQLAAPFYDRLNLAYPWLGAGAAADNASANIGQLKNLFRFNPAADRDGDDMPDWYELRYNLNPDDAADATADSDNDGRINVLEYMSGKNPSVAD